MRKPRILLIHPPLSPAERFGDSKNFTGHIHPPQGLCHLAAMFPEADFEVAIIDAQALFIGVKETLSRAIAFRPDYIGIMTFTVSVHTVAELHDLLAAALPGTVIILGGPHINACPEETFRRYPQFRLAVMREGEVTFPDLIATLEHRGAVESVGGIICRSPEGDIHRTEPRPYIRDLDSLPRPRWELLPHLPTYYRPSAMTYRRLPAVAVVTSRGCPHGCIFCDRSVFGRRWRAHGVDTVLDWLGFLTSRYGIQDINFQDDHFMVDTERLSAICEGIRRRHPQLIWSTIGRADSVDRRSVQLMRESGCWQIALGIESGSQRILDILKKGESIEQIEAAVRTIQESGMTVKGLFMAGCPTETEDTLAETERFIRHLKLDYVSMSAFTPTPNTEISGEWERYGRWEGATYQDWDKLNLWEPVFIPHGLTKEILKQFIRRAPVGRS
jgi:anaerobic magnesium-protoporphyrin IX monomethyl ester cyclase